MSGCFSEAEELPVDIARSLDSRSPFAYHECPSEVEDADPESMGKNL
jgi:hypothetical protein